MSQQQTLHVPDKEPILPFRSYWPVLVGASYGLVLRLIFFRDSGMILNVMGASFIWLVPVVVGAVTVYFAERQRQRRWAYYFGVSVVANLLFVLGTLLILIEGLICAILIIPLFSIIGGIGGLLMGAICRWTRWPKHTLYSLVPLPLLLGLFQPLLPSPVRIDEVQRTATIHASPAAIWNYIVDTGNIQPEEVRRGWIYRIGVPMPEYGVVEPAGEGWIRRVRMGKGIYFDQVITDWQPERRIHFVYRFFEDSVPSRALDDHVHIGGPYFDLLDTTYTLVSDGDATQLTIQIRYRVSTQFNWYARPLARLLIGNLEDTLLGFYRRRSEANGVTIHQSDSQSSSSYRGRERDLRMLQLPG